MTFDGIARWLSSADGPKRVRVTLENGTAHDGFLFDTPEFGLYHVVRPRPAALNNIWADDIAVIEALPD